MFDKMLPKSYYRLIYGCWLWNVVMIVAIIIQGPILHQTHCDHLPSDCVMDSSIMYILVPLVCLFIQSWYVACDVWCECGVVDRDYICIIPAGLVVGLHLTPPVMFLFGTIPVYWWGSIVHSVLMFPTSYVAMWLMWRARDRWHNWVLTDPETAKMWFAYSGDEEEENGTDNPQV